MITTDPSQFAHLHVHDEYSLLDGFATVSEYVEVAQQQNWKHVAITNHGMMGGIPKQFKACDGKVVAIFGCEVYINDHIPHRRYSLKEHDNTPLPEGYDSLEVLREKLKRNYHLTLLAKNPTGFENLVKITSDAWINGFYRRPHITREFIEKNSEGLIAGTACMSGLVSKEILSGDLTLAREHLLWFKDVFKDDFFVEIMLLDIEGHEVINTGLIKLMIECGISVEDHLVITNDSHYAKRNDSFFQNVMLLLQRRQTFIDKADTSKNVFQFDSLDLWYKTVPELDETYLKLCDKYSEFGNTFTHDLYRQAKLNTVKFASRCEREVITGNDELIKTCIELDRSSKFPKYCPPDHEREIYYNTYKSDSDAFLKSLTYDGLKIRGFESDQKYIDRIEKELQVIKSKNFSDYFLIVRDIVRFARENNIVVGPGRGCFLPYNKVAIKNKTKNIQDIKIRDSVNNYFYGQSIVVNKFEYEIDEDVVELIFANDTVIDHVTCTLDHKILTKNKGWVRAKNINDKHKIQKINQTTYLSSKKIYRYKGTVYDLEVDTDDHSYNIENIVVHNSAAGSLLTYCLGITDVDPIKHHLFFERFLNEGRKDFPDIDIDFAPKGRDLVKQYIVHHYDNNAVRADIEQRLMKGFYSNPKDRKVLKEVFEKKLELPERFKEKRTCFIGTYGSFQTKNTILDVCRTFNVPLHVARMITKQLMNDIDDLTTNEIFEIPEYKRILSLLDIKNKRKPEYFFAEPNDVKCNGQISKLNLLTNIDEITNEQIDQVWDSLVEQNIIDNEGFVLNNNPVEILVDDNIKDDLLNILQHANYITPLESVWKIRNRQKNISQHAAGVIISNIDLRKKLPLMAKGDLVLSSWIEGLKATELALFGFIKWDILGLLNLVYIDDTLKLINERYKKVKIYKTDEGESKKIFIKDVSLKNIDSNLNDPEVYKYLRQGKSSLIFQFESPLMRKLLKDSDCDNFECLTACTALGRPGPLQSGMTEEFCFRKLGVKEYSIHPVLQETLDYSYGIVVYQEQIMQIVNILAGYSLAETDNFRKILIKFRKDVVDETAQKMAKYREQFITGGSKYMSLEELEKLFDDFQKWAGYGFNRSHAVSYTIISYRCAWLKTYFPLEYITSVLQNTNKGDVVKKGRRSNKYEDYIHEALRLNLRIEKVDINKSFENFQAEGIETIRIGFSNIKGISEKPSKTIVSRRPYTSFNHFLSRISEKTERGESVTKKVVVPLIFIGAFDNLDEPIGRIEAYLHYVKFKKIDLSKEYASFEKNKDKDDLSKKMMIVINQLATDWNVKIGAMNPKFTANMDLSKVNFGKIGSKAFSDDVRQKLIESNYLDVYGRVKEKYFNESLNIGLTKKEHDKICEKINNILSSKLELSHDETDLFFSDVFGFSLDHVMLNQKIDIAKETFELKMQTLIGINDNLILNSLKSIAEIKDIGFGRGVGLIVDFEERTSKNGDVYCVITLEDGYGEENRIRIFCWSESYKLYGKLLNICHSNDINRIKIKDRVIYFDVVKDPIFYTFAPQGCPAFFKFGLVKNNELHKDVKLFINSQRILREERITQQIMHTVQDIVGYHIDMNDECPEDEEDTRFKDEERVGTLVSGIPVEETSIIIGYIAGIRECETEAKAKHPDTRIKTILKWIDLTIGDYTGSFEVRVWKSKDYIGEKEVLNDYDLSKSISEKYRDNLYNETLNLKSGMMVKAIFERLPDYRTLFGENKIEILKKTFVLKKIVKLHDTLPLLKQYAKDGYFTPSTN